MAPVTEVLHLTLKEGQEADYLAFLPEFTSTLLQDPTIKGVHTAQAIEEDNNTHYILIDWESIGAHEAYKKKDIFKPLLQKLLATLTGPPTIYHAELSPAHPSVLHNGEGKVGVTKSPVVELLRGYFPAGEAFTADQKVAASKRLQDFLSQLEGNAEGHTGETAAGWVLEELEHKGEKCSAILFAIGWVSVDAHIKYRDTEHFKKTVPILLGIEGTKGLDVVHLSTKSW